MTKRPGCAAWALALWFIARTPQDLNRLTLEAHREIAERVGRQWISTASAITCVC